MTVRLALLRRFNGFLVGLNVEVGEEEEKHNRIGKDPIGEQNWIITVHEE